MSTIAPTPVPPTPPNFRKVPAGAGLGWWGAGWRGFLRAPLPWVGLSVAWLVILVIVRKFPLGQLLAQWLSLPVGAVGVIFAAILHRRWTQARDITPEGMPVEPRTDGALSLSLSAWRERIGPLLLVSLLVLAIGGAIGAVIVLGLASALGLGLGAFAVFNHMQMSDMNNMAGWGAMAGGAMGLILLVLIALYLISVAFWFANTLVALAGMRPWEAIKLSVRAGFANIGAISLFSVLLVPIGLLAMLPMGLGLLILLPVLAGASTASYYDVFEPDGR